MDQLKNQKIVFVHLLNDYSGSPLVLSNVIEGLRQKGHVCDVITSAKTEGFLTGIEGVNYQFFEYRWHSNKYLRLVHFLWSQLMIYFMVLKYKNQNVNIYINTILPFGAALAGRMTGKKVTYHLHEVSIKPMVLKHFLRWIANLTSDQNIYVSNYLKETEGFREVEGTTIYNALSSVFKEDADKLLQNTIKSNSFTVLMLCSLKDYKGVKEFVEIAQQLEKLNFDLVVNASPSAIEVYFSQIEIPSNLNIFSSQTNVHPFYKKANVVLNLSHPEEWIETFGMTILEGMYYGLPCIAPPVGGPAEIIEHQKNGFLIDQRNIDQIVKCIQLLHSDRNLYNFISTNAKKKSQQFNYHKMVNEIHTLM